MPDSSWRRKYRADLAARLEGTKIAGPHRATDEEPPCTAPVLPTALPTAPPPVPPDDPYDGCAAPPPPEP
ncbi:hypothetical protein ACFV0B_07740 [Streptomyces xanthophaeus]|uniref:hypothetical protein n=1 Tax=Streptomyces xanthophaeus TaxID=67385 RepID=UPI003646327D|nr:hypothetical protein OG264_03715 [Streptomyces xanthophaeus]WST64334.1 hypothetical protein OG605_34645 [Streptomyces xanthophaeus]